MALALSSRLCWYQLGSTRLINAWQGYPGPYSVFQTHRILTSKTWFEMEKAESSLTDFTLCALEGEKKEEEDEGQSSEAPFELQGEGERNITTI